LELKRTVEVGHIFKLGYKYSQSMGLRVLNAAGEEVTPIMGSYGIGIERILSAAVELYHDQDGMALPVSIAPFEVVVTPVNVSDPKQNNAAEDLLEACRAAGLDVLFDDRDERPGVKFKDADLIGVPYRLTAGKKLAQGKVEVTERRTRRTWDVAVDAAPAFVAEKVKGALKDGP
jgi:prolyl-tRNA synthetase